MVVKIENFEGTSDTFTFPYNPLTLDDTLDPNSTMTPISYQKHNILVSGAGLNPVSLVLSGHFSGVNRWSDYRSLSKHFVENNKLKKLYFEDDKFYLGVGSQLKKTHSGERTNFIDYVFSFKSIISVLFGDTEKTSGTNGGNVDTYVFELSGSVVDGAVDVDLEDGFGNKVRVGSSAFSTGDTLKFELVKMIDEGDGIFVSEYGVVSVNGVQSNNVTTVSGFGLLKIAPSGDVSTISASNLGSVVVKFRDGYAD